ncbi:MAG: hypothetical protein CMJ83_10125 [Planctomycetes bacterium]|nr:hypothetical protein [Planctomycetota bacterium]
MQYRTLIAIGLLATGLAAQTMSGTYTVDNSALGGPGVFTNLQSAADALKNQGVSGAVVIDVIGTGTNYAGFRLEAVPGASPSNPVTFRGQNAPVITGSPPLGTRGVIEVTAWNPPMSGQPGYPVPGVPSVGTGPTDITFENLDVTAGIGASTAGVYIQGCARFTLRGCRIFQSDMGVYAVASNTVNIEANEFADISPTGGAGWTPFDGVISFDSGAFGSIVQRNRIHDCNTRGIMALDVSPLVGSGANLPITDFRVINNFFWNFTGLAPYFATCAPPFCRGGAVIVGNANNDSLIANNSIWMTQHPTATIGLEATAIQLFTTVALNEVINNIVKHDGSGACIRLEDMSVPVPPTLDSNVYDVGPNAVIGAVGTTTHATLLTWQAYLAGLGSAQEMLSVAGTAGFVGPSDLHVVYTSLPCMIPGTAHPLVTRDIDGELRGPFQAPCRGADEVVPTIAVTQSGPGANFTVNIGSLITGAEYFTAFSFDLCPNGPGTGPYLGLCSNNIVALLQTLIVPSAASLPMHFIAAGPSQTFGPYGSPGPFSVEAITFDGSSGTIRAVSAGYRLNIL